MTDAPASKARKPKWRPAPLLPAADARDGSLVFVVAVLCFLACLTAVAVLGANRAAAGWQAQLVGSATVLVRPKPGETADAAAARATETVAGVKGVIQASALEREKAEALLEPWLGKGAIMDDLPVPRLVAIELDRRTPATADDLARALAAAGVDADVDDHSIWIKDIVRAGQMARVAALGVFLLLAAATAAIIVFATRAALEARRELVEVLHLSGAEAGFIAGLFQARFARMAAVAGLIAAALASAVAAGLRLAGGGEGLTPVLPLAWSDLYAPLPAPIIAAIVAGLAARFASLRMLREMA